MNMDFGTDKLSDLRRYLAREFDMEADDVSEMLDIFFDSMGSLLNHSGYLLNSMDFTQVKTIGHTIKGSAGNIGAKNIAAMGRALENAAKTGNISECGKIVALLKGSIDNLYSEFKK